MEAIHYVTWVLAWIAAVCVCAERASSKQVLPRCNVTGTDERFVSVDGPCVLQCGRHYMATAWVRIFWMTDVEVDGKLVTGGTGAEFLWQKSELELSLRSFATNQVRNRIHRKSNQQPLRYQIRDAKCIHKRRVFDQDKDTGLQEISKKQRQYEGAVTSPGFVGGYKNIVKRNDSNQVILSTHLGYGFRIRALKVDLPASKKGNCDTQSNDFLYISPFPYKTEYTGIKWENAVFCGNERFSLTIKCPHVSIKMVRRFNPQLYNGFLLSYKVIKLRNLSDHQCCYPCSGQTNNSSNCINRFPPSLGTTDRPSTMTHEPTTDPPGELRSITPTKVKVPNLKAKPSAQTGEEPDVKTTPRSDVTTVALIGGAVLILVVAMTIFIASCLYQRRQMTPGESKESLNGQFIYAERRGSSISDIYEDHGKTHYLSHV